MAKFEVHYTSFLSIEAETREEAVERFKKLFPSPAVQETDYYECVEGKSNSVLGFCEVCERPIFEDQSFNSDVEGVMCHDVHDGEIEE